MFGVDLVDTSRFMNWAVLILVAAGNPSASCTTSSGVLQTAESNSMFWHASGLDSHELQLKRGNEYTDWPFPFPQVLFVAT